MTKTRKSILIIGILLVFTLGYSLGNESLPFNDSLKLAYQDIFQKHSEKNFETIDSIFYETDIDSLIQIESEEDIISKRVDLINFIWKNDKIDTTLSPLIEKNFYDGRYDDLDELNQINKYEIKMESGVNSIAYLFLPENLHDQGLLLNPNHH